MCVFQYGSRASCSCSWSGPRGEDWMSKIRPSKERYYIQIARAVAARGTCLRRNYGAVLVVDDQIVSTGYNGSPRGITNCSDTQGNCPRNERGAATGEDYDLCPAVHA